VNPQKREYFDRQVDWVVQRLPKRVLRMLESIPLHVEDRPSRRQMKELGVEHPDDLCGCFVGIMESDRHSYQARNPNFITIFRGGIFEAATDEEGHLDRQELREQIRVTILHELAHFVGFDEDQLEKLGYA
jgi:predicted Zn-dependent protease with MMP-like domain